MHILLVSVSYPPEVRSASDLMYELATELKSRGHKVTVLTRYPESNLEQQSRTAGFDLFANENGVSVFRVKTLSRKKFGYFGRGLSELIMPFLFLKVAFRQIKQIDRVIVYSPPLTLGLVGTFLKRKNVRFLLNIQDLFPQNAVDLGILKSQLVIRAFELLERFLYRSADVISVHSLGNKEMVGSKYPELHKKLTVIHNWVDVEAHDYSKGHLIKLDLPQSICDQTNIVAVFAGVIGPSQNVQFLIYMANELKHHEDLFFFIVGNGSERKACQKLARELKLSNVIFNDFVAREKFPTLLQQCDIGLVSLSSQNKTPVVPGKMLGYMAAGKPIAAFLQKNSDAHQIISDADCGISECSESLEKSVVAFENLLSKRPDFEKLGENGKKFAVKNFSQKSCVDHIESLLIRRIH